MCCFQSVTYIQSEIGPQGETDRQAAVAVDVPNPVGHADLPQHLDNKCTPKRRANLRQRRPSIQTVYIQLVGSQPSYRYNCKLTKIVPSYKTKHLGTNHLIIYKSSTEMSIVLITGTNINTF